MNVKIFFIIDYIPELQILIKIQKFFHILSLFDGLLGGLLHCIIGRVVMIADSYNCVLAIYSYDCKISNVEL